MDTDARMGCETNQGVPVNFKIGDRVTHKYLGAATVIGEYVSTVDSRYHWGYTILTDVKPPIRYNLGEKRCFAFPSELEALSEVIK